MRLSVSNLSFSYNSSPIFSKVSFHLRREKVMCLLGVNGAGKSTLLKCLNRILTSQSGTVLVDGNHLFEMKQGQIAEKIGYVPQYHEKMRLSVFDVVLMGRRPYIRFRVTEKDMALVEKILEDIGISHLAMRPVSHLSGGEIQKVAIARALVQSPHVLLLDEPTSNLDLKGQLDVMALVKKIAVSKGLSAVIAIHDLNMAFRFADSFLFIKDHCIHDICSKEELQPKIIQEVYGVDVRLMRIGKHMMMVPE